jgi:transcriptional regulator with XRE-family HTH domain
MKLVKRQNGENGLLAIRKRLGLSQEQLASLLHVHRSTIKFAEQGKRSLPTAALLKVAHMEILLAGAPQQTGFEDIHPAEKTAIRLCRRSYDRLFTREARCMLNSQKLAKKLAMMITLYQKTREWLKLTESGVKANRKELPVARYWKKQQVLAINTLNRCGLPLQILLKSRIAILDAEAELYKHMKLQLKKELPGFFIGY